MWQTAGGIGWGSGYPFDPRPHTGYQRRHRMIKNIGITVGQLGLGWHRDPASRTLAEHSGQPVSELARRRGQGHDITKSAGPDLESCTSIMVGWLASTDGSVMTAHSCDGNYRTWLRMEPAADHRQGAMKQIHWGTLHTESPWDTGELILKGQIP